MLSKRHLVGLLITLVVIPLPLYAYLATPRLASGLRYDVFATDLDRVAALAFDERGNLFATLERLGGQGEVVRIGQGGVNTVVADLDKPDGLLLNGDAMFIANEAATNGLLMYRAGVLRELPGVSHAEGVAISRNGRILVVEDRKESGRLLRVDPVTAEIEVLLGGLSQPEGVCEGRDGEIYFVAKSADSLQRYTQLGPVSVVRGLVKPAFLNCLADGSLLITEDRTNFGRLLRYRDGRLEVLARNLRAPQSVVVGADGALYLAEQNRQRVLRIYEH